MECGEDRQRKFYRNISTDFITNQKTELLKNDVGKDADGEVDMTGAIRYFQRNETRGYLDLTSFSSASMDMPIPNVFKFFRIKLYAYIQS